MELCIEHHSRLLRACMVRHFRKFASLFLLLKYKSICNSATDTRLNKHIDVLETLHQALSFLSNQVFAHNFEMHCANEEPLPLNKDIFKISNQIQS